MTPLLLLALLQSEPVRLIFDTDMDTDCDDAGALAMVHALADRGEAEILATVVSSKHAWSAPCVDAINTYFGRPDLPIGVPKGRGAVERGSRYAKTIAAEFLHDTPGPDKMEDAVGLYRRVLSDQTDGSVTVVTVGYLTNLASLVGSKEDRELVRRKVRRWVCMGSRYPADLDPAVWGNFKPDAESTVRAVKGWPGEVVFTGGGAFANSVSTGKGLAALPRDNPVRRVYELYYKGTVKDRHSADQIAVMVAVRGTGKPWKLVRKGHNHIFDNGTHEWREDRDNPLHAYVSALAEGEKPSEVARVMETLMKQAPKRR